MTTTTAPATSTRASFPAPAPAPLRLVRAELLKIRTTNAWWIFALSALAVTGVTFLLNMLSAMFFFDQAAQIAEDASPEDAEALLAQTDVVFQAANLYTSGQFLVLIIVLVVGIMLVTNEFYHQTATTTFLTTPHRTSVILAKVAAAVVLGVFYWAITTALNIPATALFLQTQDVGGIHLTDSAVVRAILLNLLAYVMWAVFGVGFGVLIRSQIGATITGILLYLAGYIGAFIVFTILANWLDAPWIQEWQVIVPSIASQLMVAGTELPGSPPQWVGAVVLVAWTLVSGTIGVLITRRRDIS